MSIIKKNFTKHNVQGRARKRTPNFGTDFQETAPEVVFAIEPYWENTGGGCMVQLMEFTPEQADVLQLNGLAIAISDELVGVYKDVETFFEQYDEAEYRYPGVEDKSSKHRVSHDVKPCLKDVRIQLDEDFSQQETTIDLYSGFQIQLSKKSIFILKDGKLYFSKIPF